MPMNTIITMSEKDYREEVLNRIRAKTIYDGDCWRYTGKHTKNGYGEITYRNQTLRLNRFIIMVYHKMNKPGRRIVAAHKPECRFRDCWNPDHIYATTQAQNVQDQITAGTFYYGTQNLNGGSNFNREKRLESKNKGQK